MAYHILLYVHFPVKGASQALPADLGKCVVLEHGGN
jgi:hypothetical protein